MQTSIRGQFDFLLMNITGIEGTRAREQLCLHKGSAGAASPRSPVAPFQPHRRQLC